MLIDPMLRVLGWDIENLDSVQLEHTKTKKEWIDYALMESTGPIAVIEAKALGKPLEDKATDQAIIYAHRANIPYMIVSDGDHWRMFARIDIWVNVANYLIETNKISEGNCPVCKTENAATYLLHTKSRNRNNVEFHNKKRIKDKDDKDLWLFTNFTPTDALKNACWLLTEFGKDVSPSTVLVSTNQS